jgi:hypothetical protein
MQPYSSFSLQVKHRHVRWLDEWKRRGLVTTYTDAIIQALRAFKEKVTEQDLKLVRLANIEKIEDQ